MFDVGRWIPLLNYNVDFQCNEKKALQILNGWNTKRRHLSLTYETKLVSTCYIAYFDIVHTVFDPNRSNYDLCVTGCVLSYVDFNYMKREIKLNGMRRGL